MSKKLSVINARNGKKDKAMLETITLEEIQLVLNYRNLQDRYQEIMYQAIAHMVGTVGKKPALRLVQSFSKQGGNV